jgi:hypothetical protein
MTYWRKGVGAEVGHGLGAPFPSLRLSPSYFMQGGSGSLWEVGSGW